MYEDSWYSFVPDLAKRSTASTQPQGHRRKESLLQQPNVGLPFLFLALHRTRGSSPAHGT